jgi:hypothetical protein
MRTAQYQSNLTTGYKLMPLTRQALLHAPFRWGLVKNGVYLVDFMYKALIKSISIQWVVNNKSI